MYRILTLSIVIYCSFINASFGSDEKFEKVLKSFHPMVPSNVQDKDSFIARMLLECALIRLESAYLKGNKQAMDRIEWSEDVFTIRSEKQACIVFLREWNRRLTSPILSLSFGKPGG